MLVGVDVEVIDQERVWKEMGSPHLYEGAYVELPSEDENIEELINELLYE